MKNKKSTISVDMIIKLALGIIVFVVLLTLISKQIGKSTGETGDIVDSSRDYDRDGIADYFDKCPCNEGEGDNCGITAEDCKGILDKYYA
ncbi:MAG: hypothetical protein V1831_04315 [Candidatus Woesearchaeota archaeon]